MKFRQDSDCKCGSRNDERGDPSHAEYLIMDMRATTSSWQTPLNFTPDGRAGTAIGHVQGGYTYT